MNTRSPLHSINWLNTLFLILTPILGIIGLLLLLIFGQVHWGTWLLTGSYCVAVGCAITAGYHRLFAHKTYQAVWPLRLLFVLFASAAFEGSALEWCTDHRRHHRYTDTNKDPYNIKKGFWHAHIGWLCTLQTDQRDFNNVADLQQDFLLRFQHKYYFIIAVLTGFVFPTLLAGLWGNALAGFIIAGVLRTVINHHLTFFINSICHTFGKRKYSDLSARDNWLTALFTFGEGYHNFHHQFPIDYRNGIRFYHFDPTKWLIRGLFYLGLTSNLKKITLSKIIRYRIQHEEKQLLNFFSHTSQRLHNRLLRILALLEEQERQYAKLKKMRVKLRKSQSKTVRQALKETRREVKETWIIWIKSIHQSKPTLGAMT